MCWWFWKSDEVGCGGIDVNGCVGSDYVVNGKKYDKLDCDGSEVSGYVGSDRKGCVGSGESGDEVGSCSSDRNGRVDSDERGDEVGSGSHDVRDDEVVSGGSDCIGCDTTNDRMCCFNAFVKLVMLISNKILFKSMPRSIQK